MKIDIRAMPVFWVEMTTRHLAILQHCSCRHYDATCRAMSDNIGVNGAKLNGTLTVWGFSVSWASGEGTVRAEYRDLDLCLKLLELADLEPTFTAADVALANELRASFRAALMTANREMSAIKFLVSAV